MILAGVVFVAALSGQAPGARVQSSSTDAYELRIYTANPGRLPDLQGVFRTVATRVFARHGIQSVFAGTVLEGSTSDGPNASNMVVWIVGHADPSAVGSDWRAVESDTEWKAAIAQAEQAGPLLAGVPTSTVMAVTDFSPTISPASSATGDSSAHLYELRKYNTGAAGLPYTTHRFKVGMADILAKAGMTPVAYWTAADESAFIYLVAHHDRETARDSWSRFTAPYRAFMADYPQRPDAIAPAPRTPEENRFLVATDYSARR